MNKNKFRGLFKASKVCGECGKVMFIVSVIVTLTGYGLALAADHAQGQQTRSNTKK